MNFDHVLNYNRYGLLGYFYDRERCEAGESERILQTVQQLEARLLAPDSPHRTASVHLRN